MNEKSFQLTSDYKPAGDQPTAIDSLVSGLKAGESGMTLLGVTGSGKTFTVANVIQELQRPTLIMAHNKTLAAQLYGEMNILFPTTIIINQKRMCLPQIPLSKKMRQ